MRMGIPAVTTQAGCEGALANRIVNFNPHIMFPGDKKVTGDDGEKILNDEKAALRWFCNWVWTVSQWGPGRKILYVDELAQFGNKFSVMPGLAGWTGFLSRPRKRRVDWALRCSRMCGALIQRVQNEKISSHFAHRFAGLLHSRLGGHRHQ